MKKRAIRIAAVFFAAMLALTFCSRTIYRSTLPTVRVAAPATGTLKYSATVREFTLEAEHVQLEYIPAQLGGTLTIAEIFKQPGDAVAVGDDLCSFYAPAAEILLQEAESALDCAENNLRAWKIELREAIARLEHEEGDMRILREKMALLQDGILNGNSTRAIEEELAKAQKTAETLRKLQKEGWILRAQTEGVLCRVAAQEGAAYAGIDPLFAISMKNEPVWLAAKLVGLPEIGADGWYMAVNVSAGGALVRAEVRSFGRDSIEVYLPEGVQAGDVASLAVQVESPYEQYLVPVDALQGDILRLCEESIGDWGEKVLRVREVQVALKGSDGRNAAISGSLYKTDRVIVESSEPLRDGQIILIEDDYS